MAFVASATGAAVFGLSGVAAGLAGGALLGAGAGALYSGITGDGNILNSALTGGLIGGGVGGLGAYGAGLLGAEAAGAAGSAINPATGLAWEATGSGLAGNAPAALAGSANTPALASSVLTGANTSTGAALANASADPIMAAANMSGMTEGQLAAINTPATVGSASSQLANVTPETGMSGKEMLGYGLAGTAALSLLGGMNQPKLTQNTGVNNPSYIRPSTYSTTQNQSAYPTSPQYGSNGLPILPTSEQNYFTQNYTAGTPYLAAANGGLMSVPAPGMMQSGPSDVNFMGNDMYPTSQQHRAYYATPTQMPTSAQEVMASYEPKVNPLTGQMMKNMATGGIADAYNLGSYSDGGRLLKGPGDGVSDDIPAVIGNKQPARLADGEFVVPARIVSELGNGSTDAGAKRLYAMMDRIQSGRKKTVGKDKVAVNTKSEKHLPA